VLPRFALLRFASMGWEVGMSAPVTASYSVDRVVGQIDRRMWLTRLPKSLAFSDKPRR
jgi:hypothetical protein